MTKAIARSAHRPGAVSASFIYKAGVFAAGSWGWLVYLAVRGGPLTGWHLVAAAGTITTTLAGVLLGVRYALQRNAADRHAEIMENLVDISWHSFAAVLPPQPSGAKGGDGRDGDAGVIRLTPDLRQRPRR